MDVEVALMLKQFSSFRDGIFYIAQLNHANATKNTQKPIQPIMI